VPFLAWGVGTYALCTLVLAGAIVVRLGGHLGYVLDDPAIHLSLADTLAHHHTWGVEAGSFESASSSPLWTAALAAVLAVLPAARDLAPLLFNAAAAIAVIWLLARNQTVLRPSRQRPLDIVATAVTVVLVLFLPGLAVVGMEHSLQVALVLGAVIVVHKRARDGSASSGRLAYALVVLATLTRFESAFVALGLAAGLLATDSRRHLRSAAGLVLSAAVPIAIVGATNRAMGGGWLPNSVLAKGQATGAASAGGGLGPVDIANRLAHDPLLAGLFAVAVFYLLVRAGRPAPQLIPAWALVVATVAHVMFADVGWYERYQAYLIAIGAYLALGIMSDLPSELRSRAVAASCVVALVLTVTKANLLVDASRAADDMYRHQYQAGRFLDRYYDGEPIATDQLGYISLLHDGPLTDFGGLGDYEVLRARTAPGADIPQLWADLAHERGFRVAVLYDKAAAFRVPDTWVLTGEWRLDSKPITGVSRVMQFYATTPAEVEALLQHLRDFEDDMPPRVSLHLNNFAGFQAAEIEDRDGRG
jgi:hypothetical protein